MSNSGNVAWRYRWSGWGLDGTHADKREGGWRFFFFAFEGIRAGGGEQKDREAQALLSAIKYIVLLCLPDPRLKEVDRCDDVMRM